MLSQFGFADEGKYSQPLRSSTNSAVLFQSLTANDRLKVVDYPKCSGSPVMARRAVSN